MSKKIKNDIVRIYYNHYTSPHNLQTKFDFTLYKKKLSKNNSKKML